MQAQTKQAMTAREMVYARLMECSRGLANDDTLACMLATWCDDGAALPAWLGLKADTYQRMLLRHFPGARWPVPAHARAELDPQRHPERDELQRLLLSHRAGNDESEQWMADIVVAGCMGSDHLWQDLGLWSRRDLSDLMRRNFPYLAAKNSRDMKWKKFFYKQLCQQEGIYTCRSPSCEVCTDYRECFGPEE